MKIGKGMLLKSILLVFLFGVLSCLASDVKEPLAKEDFSSLFNKANSYENINNDSILFYAKRALEIANLEHNVSDQLNSLLLITSTEIKSDKFGEAIKHCIIAKQIALKNDQIGPHIEFLVYTGFIYQKMGFSFQALGYFREAQEIAEESNYRIASNDIHYYLGSVFQYIGDTIASCRNLLISLSDSKINSYPKRMFEAYILLSNTFTSYDSINKYLILAESLIDKHPELEYEKVVLRNKQGIINSTIGNIDLGNNQYLEAIRISKSNRYYSYLANLYNNYASLMMMEKKYDSVKTILGKALEIVTKMKITDLQYEILESTSEYCFVIGDYQKAFSYLTSASEKRKEYREQQRVQESLFLSVVVKNEQKEKEILFQENEIAKLWEIVLCILLLLAFFIGLGFYFRHKYLFKRIRLEIIEKGKSLEIADALIKGQDAERKRLAMDLHDGLSANLGALRLLVDGFLINHEKYNEISTSLIDIHYDVRNLSHRMLPPQLESYGLLMTIKNMASSINKTGKFTVKFETNLDRRLSDNLEINLYHLIHELITNATKHSNGDTIFIQLFDQGDVLNISVEDNGSELNIKDDGSGMGLKNVKARVDYLRGKFMAEMDKLKTVFMIEVPMLES